MELNELLGDAYHEGMTLEEVTSALKNIDESSEVTRLKQALSRSNSEASNYKKQLKSIQTSSQSEMQNKQSEYEKLSQDFNDLKKQLDVSNKTSQLMKNGYSEELAKQSAQALVDGDFDTFMTIQNQFIAERDKINQAEAMRNTPRPASGSSTKTITKDEFGKMTYNQKVTLRQENPTLYEELSK